MARQGELSILDLHTIFNSASDGSSGSAAGVRPRHGDCRDREHSGNASFDERNELTDEVLIAKMGAPSKTQERGIIQASGQ